MESEPSSDYGYSEIITLTLNDFLENLNKKCSPSSFEIINEESDSYIKPENTSAKVFPIEFDQKPCNLPIFNSGNCICTYGPLESYLEYDDINYRIYFIFNIHKCTFSPPDIPYVLYYTGDRDYLVKSPTLVCAVWLQIDSHFDLFGKVNSETFFPGKYGENKAQQNQMLESIEKTRNLDENYIIRMKRLTKKRWITQIKKIREQFSKLNIEIELIQKTIEKSKIMWEEAIDYKSSEGLHLNANKFIEYLQVYFDGAMAKIEKVDLNIREVAAEMENLHLKEKEKIEEIEVELKLNLKKCKKNIEFERKTNP